MEKVSWQQAKVTGGFWAKEQKLIRDVTMQKVYQRFADRVQALKCIPGRDVHFFWDSDVAKWMEAAAYILADHPDDVLMAQMEEMIDDILANQMEDGYFNSYYIITDHTLRFTERGNHELYCAGHLIEAAVAYYQATGRDRFLRAMCRYADLIEKIFVTERSAKFLTPGHEEIELALVRLWEVTGEPRYLALSEFFLNKRGTEEDGASPAAADIQAHQPVREQREAVGHAVRAAYLYAAMADIAHLDHDEAMKSACLSLFHDIVSSKMYITGSTGTIYIYEGFTYPYDLPNARAYAETCSALALALFARRMSLLDADAIYGDVVERILYNGFLSGISLDGCKFYYSNPQEMDLKQQTRRSEFHPAPGRVELFSCSCCPPNVVRFISSVADFLFTTDDASRTVYIWQYMTAEGNFSMAGQDVHLKMQADFPYDGRVTLQYHGPDATLALRAPAWCSSAREKADEKGFLRFDVTDGAELSINFEMIPRLNTCDPRAAEDCGRAALTCGPLVYCLEGIDNGENLRDIIVDGSAITDGGEILPGVPSLLAPAYRREPAYYQEGALYRGTDVPYKTFTARFIPYFALENRGDTDMLIWVDYIKHI